MKFKNGLLSFLLVSGSLLYVLSNWGCANIVPPSGGPRDTLPPRLVSATTPNFSYNVSVTPNKVVFTFDEYIDVKEVSDNLIVNPVPKTTPVVDSKLRTMTLRIKDTLQPNTTYTFNFGKAVRDVNEANILRNFTYIFSTGPYIDSMEYSGNVILAATGKTDSSLVVILHKKMDDSAVVKDRPRYLAKVDTTGHFHFHHLEPGTYAVYAMKDEGSSHKYLSKSQLFAFADSPVDIGAHSQAITLYAYSEKTEVKKSTTGANGNGNKTPNLAKMSDKEREKKRSERLQFTTNTQGGAFDILDTFTFKFNDALELFDSSRIRFTDENFSDIDAKNYRFQRDTSNKKFWLFYPWPLDTKFNIIASRDFAHDSLGRRLLKLDTITFRTKKDIDYGEVRIRIPNLNLTRNPVLQFVQQDVVKYKYVFGRSKQFKVQLFAPGEYELRILYDTNQNGVWDPGEFFGKHLQPERVVTVRKKFTIKANWDNDLDITL